MRSRPFAAVCACVVACLTVAPPVAVASADVQPFTDRLVRPVPGHTLACRSLWEMGRRSGVEPKVTIVEADGNASRLRHFRQDQEGRVVEFDAHFTANGALEVPPTIRVNGEVQDDAEAAMIARAAVKEAASMVYSGQPLSSGDTYVSPVTTEEAQALLNRFWPDAPKIDAWTEAGRIAGLRTDPEFGELVVVDRAARAHMRIKGREVNLATRTTAYFALASGLEVYSSMSIRFTGVALDLGGHEEMTCRYVVQP